MSAREAADGAFVVRGAQVIDGSGAPRFEADVQVRAGVIQAVAEPGSALDGDAVDGRGKLLCPGFIDVHSHDDLLVLEPVLPHPKLSQGVCTVVTGNCGISLAPLLTDDPPAPLDILGSAAFRFRSFEAYLSHIDAVRPAVNVAPLIGHTSLRLKHMADVGREADSREIAAMRDEVSAALDAGAFGMSTGVYYPPARAATTAELVAVGAALAGRQAMLAMHIRDEGDNIDAALREALEVGAATGAELVLSHHKVVGPANHGRTRHTLKAIDEAAARQPVCLDCYPYEAASTMLSPERAALVRDVLITWSQPHPQMSGKRLPEIAAGWGVSLKEAAQRLVPGGAIYFSMAAEDVERVLVHPLAMIGSDGLPHDRHPHPRLWGTFPRVLGHFSRDRRLMPFEQAVHKMTGLPARRFGLLDRGLIAPGLAADMVLLDESAIRDNASYERPDAPPSGIEAVWVNGRLAMWQARAADVHAGRRLRRGEPVGRSGRH